MPRRSFEPIRLWHSFASRTLTDRQRQRLEHAFERGREIPLRLLGLARQLRAQGAEIERLKSRVVLLEGKLNVALYGLPTRPEVKQILLADGVVDTRDLDAVVAARVPPDLALLRAALAGLERGLRTILLAGDLDAASAASVLAELPTAADAWIAEADVGPPDPRLRALATDVLTALSTFADASLDGVLCFQRYHQVSPGEQPRLLATAARKLSAGGVLYLEVPELGPGGAAGDAYWSNPRNLRPYSFGALLRNLEPLGGEVRTFEGRDVAGAGSARAVLYRKGGAGSG